MGFEYSNSTKRIREAHNQGHMKRKSAPLIDCDKKKTFRKKRLQVREDILKKFEILFGERFIAIVSLISEPNPKEAIYLTIEYIHRILDLIPPKAKDEGVEHQFIYTFFWEREVRDLTKSFFEQLLFREGMSARRGDGFFYRQRHKSLSKKEIKRVYENFPSLKPQIEIKKLKNSEYRQHILKCMQNCFDSLFGIWIQMGETQQCIQAFTQKILNDTFSRIKKPKKISQYDMRIYLYIVQYLKYTAQQEVKKRKLNLEIKDCVWSQEWKKNLHYQDYEVKWEIVDDEPIWGNIKNPNGNIKQLNINGFFVMELTQKLNRQYLGGNKKIEEELLKYLKEIKNEYLANNQK